jgi:hypothetical protein
MIRLAELLHSIDKDSENGLIPVESWRWPDVDHLATMGFRMTDDHHMQTEKPPKMIVYKKKSDEIGENSKGKPPVWYLEEPKRATKRFNTFNDIIDFFDNYAQPDLDKNM